MKICLSHFLLSWCNEETEEMFRKHLILTGAHNVQHCFFLSCKQEHKLKESGAPFALKKTLPMNPIKYSTRILVDSVCFK